MPATPRPFRILLMLAPAMLVILGLFAGGVALSLFESLGFYDAAGLTLHHYRSLLADREFQLSLAFTIWIAGASTLVSAFGGLAVALVLRRSRSAMLLQTGIAMPHLVLAFVLIQVISPSGLLARAAYALGLIAGPADFPQLINDRYGFGIVVTYVLKEVPFVALMVLATLVRLGDVYQEVARTLGATAWQRLRYVTLPLIWPPLISAAVLVFSYVFSAFEVPFLLGRQYPAMLSVVAQRRFMSTDILERPAAMAIALAMSILTALLVWIQLRFTRGVLKLHKPVIF